MDDGGRGGWAELPYRNATGAHSPHLHCISIHLAHSSLLIAVRLGQMPPPPCAHSSQCPCPGPCPCASKAHAAANAPCRCRPPPQTLACGGDQRESSRTLVKEKKRSIFLLHLLRQRHAPRGNCTRHLHSTCLAARTHSTCINLDPAHTHTHTHTHILRTYRGYNAWQLYGGRVLFPPARWLGIAQRA